MDRRSFFAALPVTFAAIASRKAEDDIEVLSSWVDQNSGNILALVILKRAAQKEENKNQILV